MPRSETLGYDDILNMLDYLGYQIHENDGSYTEVAMRVAHELSGKLIKHVMTPIWLAMKYQEIGYQIDKEKHHER